MHPTQKPILRYPHGFRDSNASVIPVSTLDVPTDKQADIGELDAPDWYGGTRVITGVEVRYSTNTPGTGSTWRVSLQGVTSTAPIIPDGVIAQEWTGDAGSVSSGAWVTHTFTSTRTVSKGELVALVFDYSVFGSGTIVSPQHIDGEYDFTLPVVLQANPSWTLTSDKPNVRFVCQDGSRLYFRGWFYTMDTSSSQDFQSTSTGIGIDGGDERGILWVPRRAYVLSEVTTYLRQSGATTEIDLCLYRDTTLLASKRFGPDRNKGTSAYSHALLALDPPIVVSPGENIRLTQKAIVSTARWNRCTLYDAATRHRWLGGDEFEPDVTATNRVDDGAWNTPIDYDRTLVIGVQFWGKQIALPGQHVVFR